MPGFNAKWLTNDFKQQVKDAAAPTTGHSIGPLDVLFKRFNQDVRLTDRRLNLTIRYLAATQFNWTAGESTAGLRYWQSADFRQVHMHCMHCMRMHMHSPRSAAYTLHILHVHCTCRSLRTSACSLWPTRAVWTRCLLRRRSTTTRTS